MTKLISALALAALCTLSLNAEPTLSELGAKLDALKKSINTIESVVRDTYSLLKSQGGHGGFMGPRSMGGPTGRPMGGGPRDGEPMGDRGLRGGPRPFDGEKKEDKDTRRKPSDSTATQPGANSGSTAENSTRDTADTADSTASGLD